MSCKRGFTLVELLVVIAIIAILAAIAVPRIQGVLSRARATKAQAEISGLGTAVTVMLSDADAKYVGNMFTDFPIPTAAELADADVDKILAGKYETFYTELFYLLLRQGKDADIVALRDKFRGVGDVAGQPHYTGDPAADPPYQVDAGDGMPIYHQIPDTFFWRIDVNKLADSYMEFARDPWDERYRFWPGDISRTLNVEFEYPAGSGEFVQFVPFRSYRPAPAGQDFYIYDDAAKDVLEDEIPGNPPADGLPGVPAPDDLTVYIYASGDNAVTDQCYLREPGGTTYALYDFTADPAGLALDTEMLGGGDDVNNWDPRGGWANFYR